MARVRRNSKDSETSWLQTFYKISQSETRWAKEQGWRVVNWTLTLFGALLAIQGFLFPNIPWFVFPIIGFGVLLIAFFYLGKLHFYAATTRGNADRIEKKIGNVSEILERTSNKDNHCIYLVIQVVVVLVACALFAIATFYCCPKCVVA